MLNGRAVTGVRRIGKRIVLVFDADLFLVLHLMIAGRLRWRLRGEKPGIGTKLLLATFEFEEGTLLFSEAGSRKRASMTLVQGEGALVALSPGGSSRSTPRARCLPARSRAKATPSSARSPTRTSSARRRR